MPTSNAIRHAILLAFGLIGQAATSADLPSGGTVVGGAATIDQSGANLHSVGFGAIFYPAQGLVASIDVAKPVGSRPDTADSKSNRIWMTISANF